MPDVASIVNKWFSENIACGPIARDVEAYNQAYAARAVLIEALAPLAVLDTKAEDELPAGDDHA